MADEIKKEAAKTEDTSKKSKKGEADKKEKSKKDGRFSKFGKAVKKFFKDFKGECKKIVWPDKKTILKSTGVVLLCVAILAFVIWIVDSCLGEGLKLLTGLASKEPEAAAIMTSLFRF